MKRVIVALFGLASAALFCAASPAGAANINVPAADCHAFFTDQQSSVSYLNVALQVGAGMVVQCPIPRSPLATGATTATFFIDGKTPGTPAGFQPSTTSCTVVSYNFTGAMEGSVSFTETNASTVPQTFDHLVSFPAANMTTFAYVTVSCSMLAGGQLFGVTSVQ